MKFEAFVAYLELISLFYFCRYKNISKAILDFRNNEYSSLKEILKSSILANKHDYF